MLKKLACILAALTAFSIYPQYILAAEAPVPPSLYSEAAVLMDADTGQVIFGKQMHARKYPASTTKLLTLLLAMERGNPSDIVTINDECVETVPRNTTHIALTQGEQLTFEQLEYAMMVESANDAANAIAIHLAGTIAEFAKLMNERAAQLGANDTHFTNANGLPDDNHYTSAYDLALFAKEGLTHPEFRSLAGTQHYEIPPTNKQKDTRMLNNRQYMFCLNDTYPGAFAGKTGWTEEAGKTLVTLAERDGVTLIAVVLKAAGTVDAEFKDSTALLDYGFDHFKRVAVPPDFVTSRIDTQQAVYFPKAQMRVLLPDAVSLQDLSCTLDASGQEVTLQTPASADSFMDTTAGVFPLEQTLVQGAPVEATATSDPPPREKDSGQIWIIAAAVCAGILLLAFLGVFLLRLYVLRKYRARMRRRNRLERKMMQKQRPQVSQIIDVTQDKAQKNKIRVIDQDKQ